MTCFITNQGFPQLLVQALSNNNDFIILDYICLRAPAVPRARRSSSRSTTCCCLQRVNSRACHTKATPAAANAAPATRKQLHPPNATQKQLLSKMSWVRWAVWVVRWEELCGLCERTWMKLSEKRNNGGGEGGECAECKPKNKNPTQNCEEKTHAVMSCVVM